MANTVIYEADDFCAATGTLLYHGHIGVAALEHLWRDYEASTFDHPSLSGTFCVLLRKRGRLHLFCDPLGSYKVYRTAAGDVWSSSWLAVATAVKNPRIDVQGVYEYVFQETVFGESTVLQDVVQADPDHVYEIGRGRVAPQFLRRIALSADIDDLPVATHLARSCTELRRLFGDLARSGTGVSAALSGGYDSRLIVALLLDQGVRPELHVYGKASDADVSIAKVIASGEHLPLVHIDKSQILPDVPPDAFADVVASNFHAFDGIHGPGLFDLGSDLLTRRERSRDGRLNLNGGGGEIFRNFFYLRDRSYYVRELLWAFYSRLDPCTCRSLFSERRYYDTLAVKLKSALHIPTDLVSRPAADVSYPAFRCRFWTGRNTSINNRFGLDLTPFLDHRLVSTALRIPPRLKRFGEFEAALIHAIHPRIAGYPSTYGHDFSHSAPWRHRIKELVSTWRPPVVRRYSYRVQARRMRRDRHPVLEAHRLSRVIDLRFPYMEAFFNTSRIRDPEQYARICSLEYAFQKLEALPMG